MIQWECSKPVLCAGLLRLHAAHFSLQLLNVSGGDEGGEGRGEESGGASCYIQWECLKPVLRDGHLRLHAAHFCLQFSCSTSGVGEEGEGKGEEWGWNGLVRHNTYSESARSPCCVLAISDSMLLISLRSCSTCRFRAATSWRRTSGSCREQTLDATEFIVPHKHKPASCNQIRRTTQTQTNCYRNGSIRPDRSHHKKNLAWSDLGSNLQLGCKFGA